MRKNNLASITEHGLQEIVENLESKDIIKAKLVLDHFPDFPYEQQCHIIEHLKQTDKTLALPLLVHVLVIHEKAATDHPSLPEIIFTMALQNPGLVISEIRKPTTAQKYLLQLAIDFQFNEAVPVLIDILQESKEEEIIITAIYGLGVLADPLAVDPVSEFLYASDEYSDLQVEAIKALGQIATPTALQRLEESMGRGADRDKEIIEVFAGLQDEESLKKLNTCLQSSNAHIRNHAKVKLTELGPKAIPILIANLSNPDPDLQIHSLNILQETDDQSVTKAVRKLLHSHPRDSNVRFAAYEALSSLPVRKGDYLLASGLTDPEDNVRLAAARAINHNLDELLISGLKNMIQVADQESRKMVRAIIDAQAEDLFMALVEETAFQEQAVSYLAGAHPELRTWFVNYLIRSRKTGLANLIIRQNKTEEKKYTGKVCAVDDSRMILNVYRSILTELGYEPLLFQYPAEAVDWLVSNKPDFVCTDLNMPGINGLELIKKVREKYSKEELPIVMVTTQNEVQDNNSAKEAGVNDIIYKPFDAESLGRVLYKVKSGGRRIL
ncbi:MAG: response regulator [Desulfurivibrionaceae bacterium]